MAQTSPKPLVELFGFLSQQHDVDSNPSRRKAQGTRPGTVEGCFPSSHPAGPDHGFDIGIPRHRFRLRIPIRVSVGHCYSRKKIGNRRVSGGMLPQERVQSALATVGECCIQQSISGSRSGGSGCQTKL